MCHVVFHESALLQGEDHPAVEDPAEEAGAVAASDLQAVAGPWAAAAVWTVRMVRPVLREEEAVAAAVVDFGIIWIVVATFATAAVAVVGVHRLRLAVPEAGWDPGDRDRSEEGGVVAASAPHLEAPAEGVVVVAVDLVQDRALVPTAAATITACTAATVVTAVAPAVRLRRITSETATATREITSGTTEISAAAGEAEADHRWVETHRSTIHFPHTAVAAAAAGVGEGEALDPLGPALHPDHIILSHSNRNISNRIDMGMAATAAAVLALRHNSPTRIRALRHHSVKTKARIRVSMADLLDPVGDREAHCPRPREEPLIMRQGWVVVVEEEGAAAVLGPLGPITIPPSGLELRRHRYPLERCISKSKAHPWHPRGHVQKTLFPKPHRLLHLAKSRALKNPSRRQNRQRRRNQRSPRYRPGHPPRLRRSHRPNLWHKCACLIYERKWSSGMRRC